MFKVPILIKIFVQIQWSINLLGQCQGISPSCFYSCSIETCSLAKLCAQTRHAPIQAAGRHMQSPPASCVKHLSTQSLSTFIGLLLRQGGQTQIQTKGEIRSYNHKFGSIILIDLHVKFPLSEITLKFGLVSSFPEQIVCVILKANLACAKINFITKNINVVKLY